MGSILRFALVRYALVFGFVYLCKMITDRLYSTPSDSNAVASSLSSLSERHSVSTTSWSKAPVIHDKYTIVMATYRRLDLLPRVLKDYTSGHLPSLHAIVVVWQDTTTPPPDWLYRPGTSPHVPLHVRVSEQNSMNNRFLMDSRIETQAIFMVDDDLVIQHADIEWGFRVWQTLGRSDRIVGFSGRDYSQAGDEYVFVVMPRETISMVLSNAAFMDRSFYELYSAAASEPFRQHVDKVLNCDDLLINFLVSNKTGLPPLLLQGRKGILSYPHSGLWLRDDHWPIRSACINLFANMMGGMPLIKTDFSISRDVTDHAAMVQNTIHAVQEDAWAPAVVDKAERRHVDEEEDVFHRDGHVHAKGFDLDSGLEDLTDPAEDDKAGDEMYHQAA